MLVLAGRTAVQKPDIPLVADQALLQLATINAGQHAQLLGPYSRFGWHHPGPSWFYLLDTAFLPLGSHSWSFLVATLLLNAVVAGGIVLVVARWRGPVAAVAAAVLVLVFLHALGARQLLSPWNPYAIVLPTALLILLAGVAASGSRLGWIGLGIVASFLVQTHISTAAAVVAVVAVAAVLSLLGRLRPRRLPATTATVEPRPPRRGWVQLGAIVVSSALLVLMWIPPLIQQATTSPGNFRELFTFFRSATSDHGFSDAIAGLGRELAIFPFGHYDEVNPTDSGTPASRWLAILAVVAACALLIAGARWLGDRLVRAIGVAVLVAMIAAGWSITHVNGSLYAYLVAWIAAIPLGLGLGFACLLPAAMARLRAHRRGRAWTLVPAGIAAAVAATVLATQVDAFVALRPEDQAPPAGAAVQAAASAAARSLPAGRISVEADHDVLAWVAATGISLRLVEDGRDIEVPADWVFEWGDQFAPRDDRLVGRLLVVTAARATAVGAEPGTRPVTSGEGVEVFLRIDPGAG
jgi:hypothetical protein